MTEEPQFQAVKITNAAWLPQISQYIEHFCQRAHVDGIQPGNIQTYLAQVVQGVYGRDASEFWVVFEGDKPVTFASWQVLGLPHIAKVYCFVAYNWTKSIEPMDLLSDEFIKFGEKWKAVWWSADIMGKTLLRLFDRKMKKRGFIMKESKLINVVWRKQ